MQVYIEYVILDNLIIDYLLLKYSRLILHKQCKFWWLLFYAVIGAAFAVILPILPVKPLFKIFARIAFCFFYTYISSDCKNFKDYIKYLLAFLGLTFVSGGGVIGLYYIFKGNYAEGYAIFGLPIGLIVLMVYCFMKLIQIFISYIYKKKDIVCFFRICIVTNGKKRIKTQGFIDTGNNVYDKTGKAVVFCSKKTAKNIADYTRGFGKVSVNTVNGRTDLITFKVDKIEVIENGNKKVCNDVRFAICSNGRLSSGECDLILPPAFING